MSSITNIPYNIKSMNGTIILSDGNGSIISNGCISSNNITSGNLTASGSTV